MATKKSLTQEQKDAESPVKGYQFKELVKDVEKLRTDVTPKLDTIIHKIEGVVHYSQLDDRSLKLEKEFDKKLERAVEESKEYTDTKTSEVDKKVAPYIKVISIVLSAILTVLAGNAAIKLWG